MPGRVRGLHNRIERACVMGQRTEISVADLFDDREPAAAAAAQPTLEFFVADAEKEYLTAMLSRFEGKVGKPAEALGISRKTLWEKSRRHGLRTRDQAIVALRSDSAWLCTSADRSPQSEPALGGAVGQ